ncbi:uncharacterized protein LOC110985976 isoform X2 [Acanthaster planci]|uniref:Uncharacterized protein LOC110985976 isoform X2 n=1 Tax=Acanthaster planci TaxID=133434 RepID=A0A8B7ZIV4_ACAPL|nr:uncharacterized protein LOC110985976 isoform X2 [Acanthaster planci]
MLVASCWSEQANRARQKCIYNGEETFYHPATQACCQGHIYQRAHNLEEICCGRVLHDSTTGRCCGDHTWINEDSHFCCGNAVYPREEHMQCCGDQQIDTSTHTCCSWHVIENTGECCGKNATYDPTTQHCCTGPDYTGHVATVGREAVISSFLECCNTEVIDTRRKLCCQGNVIDRETSFKECCGPNTFDIRTEVCCEAEAKHRISPLVDGKVECCGLTPYNKDRDQCCESVITPNIGNGQCCGATAYNPLQSSCCYPSPPSLSVPEIPGVQDCCSGESYLRTRHICCAGTLHVLEPGKECCGNDLYNPADQLCCAGHILARVSPTSQCCGDRDTFDPEQQTCCRGFVSNIVNGSCCRIMRHVYQAYQPTESKCCERRSLSRATYGRVQRIDAVCCGIHALSDNELCNPCSMKPVTKLSPMDNAVCCSEPKSQERNPKTYNRNTQVCKQGKVYSIKGMLPGFESCGGKIYDTESHQCCKGYIHPRIYMADKPYRMKCCGTETYVPEWHACRRHLQYEKVISIPEGLVGYCRGNTYNIQSHFCDSSNGHIRPIQEMELGWEVCENHKAENGYRPYDPSEQECCGGILIGPGETCCHGHRFLTPETSLGEGRCCGLVGYNPTTYTCCDGVLHQISAPGQVCCGRRLFDPSSPELMCCNDTLLSTADGKTACTAGVAHRPTDTVCQGRVYPVENGECCGVVLMDSSRQVCCQGRFLYDKAVYGDTCCGRVAYDALDETKKCCIDSLFHDAQNAVCCHSQIMDPRSETCRAIGDIRYSFPKDVDFFSSEDQSVAIEHTVCQGLIYPFHGECCGNEVIRSSEEDAICCAGRRQSHQFGEKAMCCGGEVMDSELYTCCGGKPLRKHYHWMTCCNGEIMGRHKCQAAQARLPRSNPGSATCGSQYYDASRLGCCYTHIYDLELYGCQDGILQPLCSGVPYDANNLTCCSGATHHASTTGCCNGVPYEFGMHTCCAEQLHPIKNGSCCGLHGEKPYSPNKFLCCDGTLRRKKTDTTQCCGSNAYNPQTDTCCEGNVTLGTRPGSCCGGMAFDPTTQACCPNTGMLSNRQDVSGDFSESCCEPGLEYNKDAGTCLPEVRLMELN